MSSNWGVRRVKKVMTKIWEEKEKNQGAERGDFIE